MPTVDPHRVEHRGHRARRADRVREIGVVEDRCRPALDVEHADLRRHARLGHRGDGEQLAQHAIELATGEQAGARRGIPELVAAQRAESLGEHTRLEPRGPRTTHERAGARAGHQARRESARGQRLEKAGVREEREEAARHRERERLLCEPVTEALSHETPGSR
jgi:hypothetical protein